VRHSISHPPALEGRTLLDELNHRIKNELASVINFVSFKAVWTDNVDAKEELSNVIDLLHQHVEVHSILTMPDRDAFVDAGEQLRKLGLAVSRCKLDRGGSASLRGVEARAAAYSAHSYTRNSYASYGYGHDYGRGYRYSPYAAAAAYAYGRS
jgi:hypothetical protein